MMLGSKRYFAPYDTRIASHFMLSYNYNLININVYMNSVHFVLKISPLYTVGEF